MAEPLPSNCVHCEGRRFVRPISLLFAIVRVQCSGMRPAPQAAWSEWATADEHAVASILYDLLKAFDHVAYQRLIDAAVRTSFPLAAAPAVGAAVPRRQARRAVQFGWRTVVRPTRHPTRVRFRYRPPAALVELLREVRASHPTVQMRSVAPMLRQPRPSGAGVEQASTSAWLPSSRRQNAKWPSSEQLRLRANKQAGAVSAARCPGGTKLWHLVLRRAKRASTAVRRARLEKSKWRVQRIRKIDGRSSVPLRQRLAITLHTQADLTYRVGQFVWCEQKKIDTCWANGLQRAKTVDPTPRKRERSRC